MISTRVMATADTTRREQIRSTRTTRVMMKMTMKTKSKLLKKTAIERERVLAHRDEAPEIKIERL